MWQWESLTFADVSQSILTLASHPQHPEDSGHQILEPSKTHRVILGGPVSAGKAVCVQKRMQVWRPRQELQIVDKEQSLAFSDGIVLILLVSQV